MEDLCNKNDDGYQIYQDEKGFYHLIKNGEDLLVGKKAVHCKRLDDGYYQYMNQNKCTYKVISDEDFFIKRNKLLHSALFTITKNII